VLEVPGTVDALAPLAQVVAAVRRTVGSTKKHHSFWEVEIARSQRAAAGTTLHSRHRANYVAGEQLQLSAMYVGHGAGT